MLTNYKNIKDVKIEYTPTGFDFIDSAMGGGLVSGSMLGISGEPGAGKSTLITQIASKMVNQGGRVLYVSGEEGASKQKKRIQRLKATINNPDNLDYMTPTNGVCSVEEVIQHDKNNRYDFIFIDSLQKLSTTEHQKDSMLKAVIKLYQYLQDNQHITIITIVQSTKDGKIAGSQKIKHELDALLMINNFVNADGVSYKRQITYKKNRDGKTDVFYPVKLGAYGLEDKKEPIIINDETVQEVQGFKKRTPGEWVKFIITC